MMSRYLVRCIQEILLVLVNLTLQPVPKATASSTAALIETDSNGNAVAVWYESNGAHEYLGEPPSVSPGTDPDRGRGVPRPGLRPTRRLFIVSAHGGQHDVVRRWTCGSSHPLNMPTTPVDGPHHKLARLIGQ
jgi:hypothetical protein